MSMAKAKQFMARYMELKDAGCGETEIAVAMTGDKSRQHIVSLRKQYLNASSMLRKQSD